MRLKELRYFSKHYGKPVHRVEDVCNICGTALETLAIMTCRLVLVKLVRVSNSNPLLKDRPKELAVVSNPNSDGDAICAETTPARQLPLLHKTLGRLDDQRSTFRKIANNNACHEESGPGSKDVNAKTSQSSASLNAAGDREVDAASSVDVAAVVPSASSVSSNISNSDPSVSIEIYDGEISLNSSSIT